VSAEFSSVAVYRSEPESERQKFLRRPIAICYAARLVKFLAILVIALFFPAPLLQAQDLSKPAGYLLAQSEERQVWVNTATGIYHYPGTRWYGNTKQGKFMNRSRLPGCEEWPVKISAAWLLLIAVSAFIGPGIGTGDPLPDRLEGAFIVAADGHFLGVITVNSYNPKSILIEFGDFGSEYSSDSIFNEYGDYRGEYSEYSPFNEFTTTPPKVYTKDQQWAYLTVNETLSPRVDPKWLIGALKAGEVLSPPPASGLTPQPTPTSTAQADEIPDPTDEQATEAFNFLQDRFSRRHATHVYYTASTDSFNWIGPKLGKKMSMKRTQFKEEVWKPYYLAGQNTVTKTDPELRKAIQSHTWYSSRHGYRFLSDGGIEVDGDPTQQRWSIENGSLRWEWGNSKSDVTKIIEINDRQLVQQEISGQYEGSVEVMYSVPPNR
jgi:hypothetical protein